MAHNQPGRRHDDGRNPRPEAPVPAGFLGPVKLPKRKLSQQVSDIIKERILLGEFPQRSSLPPIKQLAGQLHISPASLREALRVLEADGYLSMKSGPSGGPIVCHPGDEKVTETVAGILRLQKTKLRDLHEARYYLEVPVVRLAARVRSEEDLKRLHASIEATRASRDSAAFHRHSFEFHQIVADCSRNRILSLFFGCLRDLVYGSFGRLTVDQAWQETTADEHSRIYEAIRDRDEARAGELAQRHLDGFVPIYERYFDEYIDRIS
jgi:DNA-binding FadR family transcriptional regulator